MINSTKKLNFTKMKKLFISIFIIAVTLQFVNAQKVTTQTSDVLTKQQVVAMFDLVGSKHNQTLDYIYDNLTANVDYINNNLTSRASKQDFLGSIMKKEDPKNPIMTILTPSPTFPNPPQSLLPIIENSLNKSFTDFNVSANSRGAKTISDATLSNPSFTKEEIIFNNELMAIIEANYNNPDVLRTTITQFGEKVIAKFGVNSKSTYALLSGAYTAYHSAKYWFENTEKWTNMKSSLKSTGSMNTYALGRSACCGGIVKADASGAVGGALGGAAAGALAGGVGAIPGAVAGAVAGGVGNSAQQAISNLIDWLF
jgi:hypothetical protein